MQELGEDIVKLKLGVHDRHNPTYLSWFNMKRRCGNKNKSSPEYENIKYCEQWDFYKNFLIDMGERPDGCTLDRINHQLGYSKENCRWATLSIQSHNSGKRLDGNASSIYKGVHLCKRSMKWIAQITKDYRLYNLGRHDTEIEAAIVYDNKAIELWGDLASTNKKLGLLG